MNIKLEQINLNPKTLEEAVEVIGQLFKIILELKQENTELQERLNANSKNSSIPPSLDKYKKEVIKPRSGRKAGGQPGHPGWQRMLVAEENIDDKVDCKPNKRCRCGGLIELKDEYQAHQVFEIPLTRYEVTEYRIYKGHCEKCHAAYRGELPEGVSWKGFGPRACAMASVLTSQYRLSTSVSLCAGCILAIVTPKCPRITRQVFVPRPSLLCLQLVPSAPSYKLRK